MPQPRTTRLRGRSARAAGAGNSARIISIHHRSSFGYKPVGDATALFRMWFAVRGRELSRLPTAQGGAGAGAAERVRSSPRALAARPSRDAGAGRLALPPLPRTGEH